MAAICAHGVGKSYPAELSRCGGSGVFVPRCTLLDKPATIEGVVQGTVLDIDRFASHDGPGIRTAIFLKGCPLHCLWCHSPESQRVGSELVLRRARCTRSGRCVPVCPADALSLDGDAVALDRVRCNDRAGCNFAAPCVAVCYPNALEIVGRTVSVDEVLEEVGSDIAFWKASGGGVTVSGGEPLLQYEFAHALLSELQSLGVHTAVETTGFAGWERLASVAEACDLVMYDLKLIDDELHKRYTGVSNSRILDNLRMLSQTHPNVVVRIPCIPDVNDSEEQLVRTARFARECGIEKLVLLPYNAAAGAKYEWIDRHYELADRSPRSEQRMADLASACAATGIAVGVGG